MTPVPRECGVIQKNPIAASSAAFFVACVIRYGGSPARLEID
jgi:hypothetical protein